VNVGDQPVSTKVPMDAGQYGLSTAQVQVARVGDDGPVAQRVEGRSFDLQLTVPPRTAQVYELTSPQ